MSRYLDVVTHSGIFHADEVTAVALLEVFTGKVVIVKRTRDEARIAKADVVVDVGGVWDPVSCRFDHHQTTYSGELSSAGMVLDWLDIDVYLKDRLRKVFIEEVDAVDNGLAPKSAGTSYSGIISSYNTSYIYGEVQDEAFVDAVRFSMRYIENIKRKFLRDQDEFKQMEDILDKTPWTDEIVELPGFLNFASQVIDRGTFKRVIWPQENEQGVVEWKIQVPNVEQGSFELNGPPLVDPGDIDDLVFVHKNGFFGITGSKETAYKLATHNIGE